jgi:parallel beta-helix repeat protein
MFIRPSIEPLEIRQLLSAGMHHPVITVPVGGSIQAAVNAARPGSAIQIAPGTYREAVTVAKPNLTLLGLGDVVLLNPGSADDGIDVTVGGRGFVLRNITVQGFADNGVSLTGVRNFRISGVTVRNNGEYGIFPVFSAHGVIDHCTASGQRDTGIYVGQSRDVTIQQSTTFANVNGIEIENSTQVRALGNETFDNTAGVLVDLLPGLQRRTARDNVVQDNAVHDNNRPNFGVPGDIESMVLAGTGILVLGTVGTLVTGNRINGNHFVGIGLASTLLLAQGTGIPAGELVGLQPNPRGTRIRGNRVTGNGGMSPDPSLPSGDLLWDQSGRDNCWSGNRFNSALPPTLPSCRS